MADNTSINTPSVPGDNIATDDISGVKYQRVKLTLGGDGISDGDVSSLNPMPTTSAVQSVVPGTASTSLGKAAHSPADATDVGVMLLAVRKDAASIVQDNGDYAPLAVDSSGALRVTSSVGSASTIADGADVATGSTADAAITTNATGTISGKLRGLVAILADMWDSVNHRLKVDGSGVTQPVSGTFWQATQPVSGTFWQATQPVSVASIPSHAVTNAGTFVVQENGSALTSLQLIDDVIATTAAAIPSKGAAVSGTDGTNARVIKTDTSGELQVDVLTLPALAAGTAVIGKLAANSGVDIGDVDVTSIVMPTGASAAQVQGTVTQDSAAAQNPVQIAGSSETMADSAPANRVSTDGDTSRLSTTDGALYVITTGPQTWTYHEDSSSALTDTTVHAAPGAGLSLYVTDIAFSTGSATAFNLFIEEGTTTKVLGPWYLEAVAGRGAVIRFATPKKITANTSLTVTTSAAIAHSIDIQGFIAQG